MQLLIDFLPILAFWAAWKMAGMHVALIVLIVAALIQLAVTWLIKKTVHKVLVGSVALVVVLAGASLYFDNPLFIKWKPTVLNWLVAAALIGSRYLGKQTIVQKLMESASEEKLALPERDWHSLNLACAGFFALSGGANLFVAYNYSESTWVNFKLFGLLGLTLGFFFFVALWITHKASGAQQQSGQ